MKIQGPWGGLRELCTSSQLGSASRTAAAAEPSVLLFPLYPYLFENSIKIKRKKKIIKNVGGTMRQGWKREGGREGEEGGGSGSGCESPEFACDCNADRLKRDVSRRHLRCGPLGATPARGA